ncbi:hypothetical protein FQA47_019459 [Oryzias melastigma]|uniref:Uncharacterized protein n=1 Tax=Oryzias melastigma TaxID=30732 RepID=A0A834CBY7_ORYME|nr:hypothetical protein FQA47_019459 [Oryzias melastigma]
MFLCGPGDYGEAGTLTVWMFSAEQAAAFRSDEQNQNSVQNADAKPKEEEFCPRVAPGRPAGNAMVTFCQTARVSGFPVELGGGC